jgi:hypothetical protein
VSMVQSVGGSVLVGLRCGDDVIEVPCAFCCLALYPVLRRSFASDASTYDASAATEAREVSGASSMIPGRLVRNVVYLCRP